MVNLTLAYSVILAHVCHPFHHQYLTLKSTDMEKRKVGYLKSLFLLFFYKTSVLTEYPFRHILAVAN